MRGRSIIVLAALAGLVALVVARPSSDDGVFRVAVEFDSAKGIVERQQVKIAGAVVGRVDRVELIPGPAARLELSIDRRFGPFRADARCAILPEGLISENYVSCEPGTSSRLLRVGSGGIPTVPMSQTTLPVSLQDLLNVFAAPTSQRLPILLGELGIATAGRGTDLNAMLRRANPALAQARRATKLIVDQRRRLSSAVEQTDRVLAALAARDNDVRRFVRSTARVTGTTARRSAELRGTVAELPRFLRRARPALAELSSTARSATPLLVGLEAAGAPLLRVAREIPRFERTARPAIRALRPAAREGRAAIRSLAPVARRLERAAEPLATLAPSAARLLTSLRDRGGIEGFFRVAYSLANAASLYDDVSHMLTFRVGVAPRCVVGQLAERPVRGCATAYRAEGAGALPVNAPVCGPKDPSWYQERCDGPVLRERRLPPTVRKVVDRAVGGRPPTVGATQQLLDFLLRP